MFLKVQIEPDCPLLPVLLLLQKGGNLEGQPKLYILLSDATVFLEERHKCPFGCIWIKGAIRQ